MFSETNKMKRQEQKCCRVQSYNQFHLYFLIYFLLTNPLSTVVYRNSIQVLKEKRKMGYITLVQTNIYLQSKQWFKFCQTLVNQSFEKIENWITSFWNWTISPINTYFSLVNSSVTLQFVSNVIMAATFPNLETWK